MRYRPAAYVRGGCHRSIAPSRSGGDAATTRVVCVSANAQMSSCFSVIPPDTLIRACPSAASPVPAARSAPGRLRISLRRALKSSEARRTRGRLFGPTRRWRRLTQCYEELRRSSSTSAAPTESTGCSPPTALRSGWLSTLRPSHPQLVGFQPAHGPHDQGECGADPARGRRAHNGRHLCLLLHQHGYRA